MIRNGSLQDCSYVTLIGYQRERGFTVEKDEIPERGRLRWVHVLRVLIWCWWREAEEDLKDWKEQDDERDVMEDEVSVVSFYVSANWSQKMIFSVSSFVSFHPHNPLEAFRESLIFRWVIPWFLWRNCNLEEFRQVRTDNIFSASSYLQVLSLCSVYLWDGPRKCWCSP